MLPDNVWRTIHAFIPCGGCKGTIVWGERAWKHRGRWYGEACGCGVKKYQRWKKAVRVAA